MLKAFSKLPITKSIDMLKNRGIPEYVATVNNSFSTNKPNESAYSQAKNNRSVHRQAFEGMKTQIKCEKSQEAIRKYALGSSFEGMKHKLYENFKVGRGESKHEEHKHGFEQPTIKTPYDSLHREINNKEAEVHEEKEFCKVEKTEAVAENKDSNVSSTINFKANLSSNSKTIWGSVCKLVTECVEETFPTDNFHKKAEQIKRKAKAAKLESERQIQYTEEELEMLQGTIPEWKRTAIATIQGDVIHDSVRRRIMHTLKEKVNETDTAKSFYQSESYKEYQTVRQELHQFKEDFKDHLAHSQNPAVVASLTVYSKVTTETNTARAIQEMRKFIPHFSVYELEKDARGVFCQIYDAFLEGNLEFIQKTCGESALVYFRTLLKKREVDSVCPKYNCLWESEPADLIGGKISENNRPCFSFTIRVQEIHCNVSKKNNKVVDGAEDHIQQNRFNFVLTIHENPDLEETGHSWELVEILPVEAVHMLA